MQHFKKLMCLVLAAVCLISLAACGKKAKEPANPTSSPTTANPSTPSNPTSGNEVTPPTSGSNPSTPTTPAHIHSFGAWQTDSKNHWKTCSCGEKSELGAHTDADANEKCDNCSYAMPIEKVAPATAEQLKNIAAVKSSSAGGAITAHPGGRITYKIAITNNNSKAVALNVTDTLPANTLFVSGCESVSGSNLAWEIKAIEPGKTVTLTYTVKPNYTVQQVRESKTDIILKNTSAKVMDKTIAAPAKDIWVLETFNAADQRRIEMAIDSLVTANVNVTNTTGVKFSGGTLVSNMYTVGFSKAASLYSPTPALQRIFEIAGDPSADQELLTKANNLLDLMVPGLYGGTTVPASKDSLFRGERATSVTFADLISGDVIYVNNGSSDKMYVVRGNILVDVGLDYVITGIDPATVVPYLVTSNRYAVVRPSINLATSYSLDDGEYYNEYDKQAYTELEKALIATAESYLLRGDRTQYTDDMTGKSMYRAESGIKQPEDYTVDQYGYTNCAFFTHDVHWVTYGYSIKAGSTTLNTTTNLINSAAAGWNANTLTGTYKSTIFYYEFPTKTVNGEVVSTLTDAEKEAVYQQYISLLRPGDLVVYRYHGDSAGHVMLYVGKGLLIHSTGGNFPSGKTMDTHEPSVRYMNVDDLFDINVNPARYIFHQDRFAIIRPQNLTTPKITANTANRIANMQGIVGEKVSSTAMGKTVNPGDTITYTFYVFNTDGKAKAITINDVLGQYVTFVSATNSGSVSGNNISWNITVPANTRISVSYTVKVKDGVATYTAIDGSKATINSVTHKCYNTYVANTLTTAQQQALINAVNTVRGMDRTGLGSTDVAELIYKTAFGVDDIFGEGVDSLGKLIGNYTGDSTRQNVGVFNDTTYWSDNTFVSLMDSNTSKAAMMVAPGMYGGQKVYSSSKAGETYNRYLNMAGKSLRSRYFWEKDLVVGDLYFMKGSSATYFYIYVGNGKLVNLTNMQEYDAREWLQRAPDTSKWHYYAILRPSIANENI